MKHLSTLLALSTVSRAAKYEEYILAPSSRTVYPVAVHQGKVNGTVDNPNSIAGSTVGSVTFHDTSAVTYDFGKNIAGVVTLKLGQSDANQFIGLTYSESSLWISGVGSDGTQDSGIDEVIGFYPTGPGDYTVSREHERGGFRYLSLVHNTTGSTEVQQISVDFTAAPTSTDLRNYAGYFSSSDTLLNRAWYAGAYTNQLCSIDPHHGDSLVHYGQVNSSVPGDTVPPWTWYLNSTLFNGTSAISDGAKRDRLVWPGDIAVSGPSIFVSTNDVDTIKQSIDSLYALQNASGFFPYASSPFSSIYSPTYHQYSLINLYNYFQYTQDIAYLQSRWNQWKRGLNYSLSFIDDSGLFNATTSADWLRVGMGGHNIEANAILHYVLSLAVDLGTVLNDTAEISHWQSLASTIKIQANAKLWDTTAGLYRDNETTTLMPQDGNSWAVISNLTESQDQSLQISSALQARWGPYGAPAPEAGTTVSPFIGGFEIQTHALAGNVSASIDLLRLEWGFMLDDPRMTNSTFIEGYSTNGALHYSAYTSDPRISHSHGWATGCTSFLSFYVAGLQLVGAAGSTWKVAPRPGDLTFVDAGYSTPLGSFSATTNVDSSGGMTVDFSTPVGTEGVFSIEYPACSGTLMMNEVNGNCDPITVDVVAEQKAGGELVIAGVQGGEWQVKFTCNA